MADKGFTNLYFETLPVKKLLLKFSVPTIISMLVSALYNIVDQVFIGQGVGYIGNAATTVVYPFTVIALAISLLICDGSASLFSISLGKKDYETAKKSIANNLLLSVFFIIVITFIGFLFKNDILKLFGVTDSCFKYASDYMGIILIGIPFYMFTSSFNGIIRADGSPKYSMIATVTGALINLILDPVAIFVFDLGVKGAAIATVIGQLVSFIISFYYLKKIKSVKFEIKDIKNNFKVIKKIMLLGISSFIIQIAIVIVIAVSNNLIVKYGLYSV
ncbi:MAG TPA: MATE family efflux transporter, partial [Tepiditoga sp.]|nr:MATE family efflux transporter [Tepiditoga sp.]